MPLSACCFQCTFCTRYYTRRERNAWRLDLMDGWPDHSADCFALDPKPEEDLYHPSLSVVSEVTLSHSLSILLFSLSLSPFLYSLTLVIRNCHFFVFVETNSFCYVEFFTNWTRTPSLPSPSSQREKCDWSQVLQSLFKLKTIFLWTFFRYLNIYYCFEFFEKKIYAPWIVERRKEGKKLENY